MTYKLAFKPRAQKEWDKLDGDTRGQFVKKLKERLENPRVPSARLHELKDCYKIKLKDKGYRLIYQVIEEEIVVLVLAVGKRENNNVYDEAEKRQ